MYVVQKQAIMGEYVDVLACQRGSDAVQYRLDNEHHDDYRIIMTST